MSRTSRSGRAAPSVPWTITFADMALLLLCFFVMLSSRRVETPEVAAAPAEAAVSAEAPVATTAPLERDASSPALTAALLRGTFATEIEQGWLAIDETEHALRLRFGTVGAFDRGSDTLTPLTATLLDTLAVALATNNSRIVVAGHSDDLPISTGRFRDNWDLSAARAVSVIRELVNRHGLDPARLEAKGYADTRPLVPNDSETHRLRNRRIEIEVTWPH